LDCLAVNVQLLIRRTIEIFCTNDTSGQAAGPEEGSALVIAPPGGRHCQGDSDTPDTAGFPSHQRLHILLVEDHEDTLAVLNKLLTGRGHAVTTAASNSEALRAAEAGPFDLVLSDLGLPDGLAYDMMRTLHNRFGATGIALSGYGTESDLRRSRAAGFVEHLTKPVDFDTLIATIERVAPRIRNGR
jgi:hypothetical protein